MNDVAKAAPAWHLFVPKLVTTLRQGYRLADVVDAIGRSPKVFILRMREVPMIDASGATRLRDFIAKAGRSGTSVILSGLQRQPAETLRQMQVLDGAEHVQQARDLGEAIALARRLIEKR